ncbi:hypothetical protein ACHHRT_13395, partial [Desulfurivibrio sp. D14AmB]|uniref:hypothetical protein n=1 Tax=Desulfurivibrio sp. D14AmB TaxID=3374370 RepID=UPI00376F40B8
MRKIEFVFTGLVRRVKWFWRGWPVLAVVAVIFVHLVLLWNLSEKAESIDKAFSIFSQIIGGLLVIYSINSVVFLIKKNNLFGMFRDYLSELFDKRNVLCIENVTQIQAVGSLTVEGYRVPENLEDKILHLQKQIDKINFNLDKEVKRINKVIEIESSDLMDQVGCL